MLLPPSKTALDALRPEHGYPTVANPLLINQIEMGEGDTAVFPAKITGFSGTE